MGDEVFIHASDLISIDAAAVVAELRARGLPVVWHYRYPAERRAPETWTAGYVLPEGKAEPQVAVAREPVTPGEQREWFASRADRLSEEQRQQLAAARTRYRVYAPDGDADERRRLLVHLADVIASATGGLIEEVGAEGLCDGRAFRVRHPELRGAADG